jgi:hypothetical protein
MRLPIDFRKAPFKSKYLDEETPATASWVVFGVHADSTVDISDGQSDIITNVPKDVAKKIIDARNTFVNVVLDQLGLKS